MRRLLVLGLAATAATACTPDDQTHDFDHVGLLLHLEPDESSGTTSADAGPRMNQVTPVGDLSWREGPQNSPT